MSSGSNNPDVFLRAESALVAVPPNAAVVALMRHGEKEPMSSASPINCQLGKYDDARYLTARGKTDAKIMGRLLMGRITRLEHSIVPRCQQTATSIAYGANFDEVISENPRLNGLSFQRSRSDMQIAKENAGSFSNLIDRLATDGCYPGFNPVHPFMATMTNSLLNAAKPGINVSVSHDWILYLMLVAIGIKTKPFTKQHVSYLETLFLWREDARIFFYYRHKQGTCDDAFCKLSEKKQQ